MGTGTPDCESALSHTNEIGRLLTSLSTHVKVVRSSSYVRQPFPIVLFNKPFVTPTSLSHAPPHQGALSTMYSQTTPVALERLLNHFPNATKFVRLENRRQTPPGGSGDKVTYVKGEPPK